MQRDFVLEEVLVLVHGVVLVDVLHIGRSLVGRRVTFAALVRVGRVTFGAVDVLVTVENAGLGSIEVRTAEVVVVVARRVVVEAVIDFGREFAAYLVQVVAIDFVGAFVCICKAVETDVLFLTSTAFVREGIDNALLGRHTSPGRFGIVREVADRHTAFVEFLSVLQHVFAHVAEVDDEVAAVFRVILRVDEGVEHPEFDVLDVGSLKVAVVEFTHHTTPTLAGVVQQTFGREVWIEVVWSTLTGVVRHVEHLERVAFALVRILVRIDLAHIDLADVVVGELVKVALDVSRGEARRTACEQRVNLVPGEQRAVETVFCIVRQTAVLQVERCRGEHPGMRFADVDALLGLLEVVDVGGVALHVFGIAGNELRHFGRERDARRLAHVDERNLVDEVGQPLRLCLPVQVQAPDGVVERFAAHGHFRRERLFRQSHEGTAQLEVLCEVVTPVQSEHRLSDHAVFLVAFEADVDIGACVENALVDDGDLTQRVVHLIVRTFGQFDATCGDTYRTLRNVHGAKVDFATARAFVFAKEREFVELRNLSGDDLG